MKKFKRNERIGALMKMFSERPNHIFSYNYFSDIFNSAKSTISEDIVIVKKIVEDFNYGEIKTIAGAAGGVVFTPKIKNDEVVKIQEELCDVFSDEKRIIPGGFIYMTDVFNNPYYVHNIAKIIVSMYENKKIDYVVTVETKGIPAALMTAREMDVPLVVIRRNTKVTEGSTLSINYVSGSSSKIQTMTLSRRALKEGSKVLIVDDFMKGGGTVRGMRDMMREFDVEVEGVAVVVSTKEPKKKLFNDFNSLLVLEKVDEENKKILIKPNRLEGFKE